MKLNYLIEKYQLLFKKHTEGRKFSSIENAIYIILEEIHKAWKIKNNQMIFLLMLNVKGVFDNVSHVRLLHNLRKRDINERVIKWIQSFLGDRSTIIIMPKKKSFRYEIKTNISQGSPISSILYLFYNANIADICKEKDHLASIYINDVNVLMREFIAQANCEIFKKIHFEIQRWAITHASKFEINKYQLMHFWFKKRDIKKIKNNDLNAKLNLKIYKIESTEKAKLLNINFDSELKWITHIQLLKTKTIVKLNELTCYAELIKNILYQELRKLYQDMILFTLLFECLI